jgi:hypothetical protein
MDLSIRFDREVHIHFDDKKIDEITKNSWLTEFDRENIALDVNE